MKLTYVPEMEMPQYYMDNPENFNYMDKTNGAAIVNLFNYILRNDYMEVGSIAAETPEGRAYYSYIRKKDTYYVLSPLEYAGVSSYKGLPEGVAAISSGIDEIKKGFEAEYSEVEIVEQYKLQ